MRTKAASAISSSHVVVRIPTPVYERLQKLADRLSNPSTTWLAVRAIEDMLDLCDTPPHKRVLPQLVRMADAAGTPVSFAETKEKPARASEPLTVKAGRG